MQSWLTISRIQNKKKITTEICTMVIHIMEANLRSFANASFKVFLLYGNECSWYCLVLYIKRFTKRVKFSKSAHACGLQFCLSFGFRNPLKSIYCLYVWNQVFNHHWIPADKISQAKMNMIALTSGYTSRKLQWWVGLCRWDASNVIFWVQWIQH